jgi:pimeloyl-ACP methyl ester carboxylesterase
MIVSMPKMLLGLGVSLALGCALMPVHAAAEETPAAPVDAAAKPWLTLKQLRAKYGDHAGRIALIGGVEVYYKDEGQGPPLLLVHGSVSSLKTWDGLAAQLVKAGYRVIRFDIPPQGLSGPVPDEILKTLVPTDIPEQLLAKLGVKKVTVIGVSSGGTMGVQLAAKRPDLVERLIISNAPADPVTTDHQVMTPRLEAAIAEQKKLGYQSQFFWEAFLDFYAGVPARYDATFREQIYDMNRKAPQPNFIGLVAKVGDHEKAVAAMNAVTAPVLLIWGGADPLLPYSAMDKLAGYLTKAEVSKMMMPDVGHYPPVEIPDRYARIVVGYIEGAVPTDAKSKR